MIDVRVDSIIYQSQVYYSELVNSLVLSKRIGKSLDSKWEKADLILGYLEALQFRFLLTEEDDITDVNYILNCLIILCELNEYPNATPIAFADAPPVVTQVGPPGMDGDIGPKGDTGLATDFQAIGLTVTSIVDSFDITDAEGARWDYWVKETGGAQRVSSILGHWTADGTSQDLSDMGAPDLVSTTAGIEFDIQIVGTTVQLIAVITSGTWNVRGSRYFIPNNGNGTGPISNVLSNGLILIGNNSNIATARAVSGAITISNLGVTTLGTGVIQNTNIANAAAIDLTKLAALNANIVPITNGSGFLTSSTLDPTTLGFVDISSSLTGLLNTKLTNPTTTIGDIIIRNNSNVTTRLGIGTSGQILTVSGGVPVWSNAATGFSDPMTSIGDIIIRNASNATTRLGIGGAGQILSVVAGVPAWTTAVGTGITTASGTTYTILTTDNIVQATNTGARTFTLPLGSSMPPGKIVWIKDAAGTAGTNAITVQRTAPNTFEDASTSVQIIGDRSVVGFYWNNTTWSTI